MTRDETSRGPAVDACTLPLAERPLRRAEFDDLFAAALRRVDRQGPELLRLELEPAAEDRARDLAARETRCCSFFTFTFAHAAGGLQMDVRVPSRYAGVLDALAAHAAAALS